MKKLFLLLLLIFLSNCNSTDEQGIRDSRHDFMMEFQKALSKNNIPYSIDSEGYIRYSIKYKKSVEKIKKYVDEIMASEVGTKFEDEISTKYFRKLLDEYKISYRIVSQENGEWTYWHPESKNQEKEIEMKVVSNWSR